MILFRTILIQLPCNPFKYIFVHMRQKKTFRVLSFVWCKNIVCYDLALQDIMTKRVKKNIKENYFKSVKALKVIAILTAYLWFLFNSKSIYQAPFRAKNVAFFCDTPSLQLLAYKSTIYGHLWSTTNGLS